MGAQRPAVALIPQGPADILYHKPLLPPFPGPQHLLFECDEPVHGFADKLAVHIIHDAFLNLTDLPLDGFVVSLYIHCFHQGADNSKQGAFKTVYL
ncbi:hypothetical protein SDC9_177863 [bioreactor metagenome]|uniref:Uncharacterized protein n=1 Tax=bioreactor metagenome TaxID=1076179 RepID=A0A645GWH2_9ZZZZ